MSDLVKRLRAQQRHQVTDLIDRFNKQRDRIDALEAALVDAIETLEAMDLHIDNPLYMRLRAALEKQP